MAPARGIQFHNHEHHISQALKAVDTARSNRAAEALEVLALNTVTQLPLRPGAVINSNSDSWKEEQLLREELARRTSNTRRLLAGSSRAGVTIELQQRAQGLYAVDINLKTEDNQTAQRRARVSEPASAQQPWATHISIEATGSNSGYTRQPHADELDDRNDRTSLLSQLDPFFDGDDDVISFGKHLSKELPGYSRSSATGDRASPAYMHASHDDLARYTAEGGSSSIIGSQGRPSMLSMMKAKSAGAAAMAAFARTSLNGAATPGSSSAAPAGRFSSSGGPMGSGVAISSGASGQPPASPTGAGGKEFSFGVQRRGAAGNLASHNGIGSLRQYSFVGAGPASAGSGSIPSAPSPGSSKPKSHSDLLTSADVASFNSSHSTAGDAELSPHKHQLSYLQKQGSSNSLHDMASSPDSPSLHLQRGRGGSGPLSPSHPSPHPVSTPASPPLSPHPPSQPNHAGGSAAGISRIRSALINRAPQAQPTRSSMSGASSRPASTTPSVSFAPQIVTTTSSGGAFGAAAAGGSTSGTASPAPASSGPSLHDLRAASGSGSGGSKSFSVSRSSTSMQGPREAWGVGDEVVVRRSKSVSAKTNHLQRLATTLQNAMRLGSNGSGAEAASKWGAPATTPMTDSLLSQLRGGLKSEPPKSRGAPDSGEAAPGRATPTSTPAGALPSIGLR